MEIQKTHILEKYPKLLKYSYKDILYYQGDDSYILIPCEFWILRRQMGGFVS